MCKINLFTSPVSLPRGTKTRKWVKNWVMLYLLLNNENIGTYSACSGYFDAPGGKRKNTTFDLCLQRINLNLAIGEKWAPSLFPSVICLPGAIC